VADPRRSDLEALWDEEWEAAVIKAALARVRRTVNPKDFLLFDCYVIKKWPAEKVRRDLKVSRTRLYLAKYRVTKLLSKETARLRARNF
jgi:RNA polymerase sigma-70 factor (ECF subfamily)